MKKLFFTAMLLFFVAGVYGQKKVLKDAEKAFKKGEYAEAISLAQQAASDAETKDEVDVYLVLARAKMNQYMADKENIALAKEANDYFLQALSKGDEKLKDDLYTPPVLNNNGEFIVGGDGILALQNVLMMQGNAAFEVDDFEKSYEYFSLAADIQGTTVLNFYAGYSAYNAEMSDEAIPYYLKVVESDDEFENRNFAYNGLIDIYSGRDDYDKALEYVRKAKVLYPEEQVYRDFEIDLLIQADKLDEAIAGIKQNIAGGDKTAVLWYTLAYLQWNNNDFDDALESAKEALKLDPGMADAHYVVGSVYFNQGAELIKEANAIDDDAAYKAKKEEGLAKFRLAMPSFEKGLEAKPEDLYMLRPLSTIYDQLEMDAKRDAILARIEAIEGRE